MERIAARISGSIVVLVVLVANFDFSLYLKWGLVVFIVIATVISLLRSYRFIKDGHRELSSHFTFPLKVIPLIALIASIWSIYQYSINPKDISAVLAGVFFIIGVVLFKAFSIRLVTMIERNEHIEFTGFKSGSTIKLDQIHEAKRLFGVWCFTAVVEGKNYEFKVLPSYFEGLGEIIGKVTSVERLLCAADLVRRNNKSTKHWTRRLQNEANKPLT